MVTFLAGNITENIWQNEGIITNRYNFRNELNRYWYSGARILYICSDPEDFTGNDGAFLYYRNCFSRSGFSFSSFDLVDNRYSNDFSFGRLASYDVIILGSGRVPLQHSFLERLHLREFFESGCFHGIVIGISAGALNCATETYNWPEEPGDTYLPYEQKFYRGLGLAKLQVLPHFQARYDMYVDGRHLYNDITMLDSLGHEFLAIPDYSFVECRDGYEQVFGPHSYYRDGYYYDFEVEQRRLA